MTTTYTPLPHHEDDPETLPSVLDDQDDAHGNDDLLDLTTQIAPPTPFKIDDVIYRMRDLRHLNAAQEAHFYTLVEQDSQTRTQIGELVKKGLHDRADRLGVRLADLRVSLIAFMTDAPEAVIRQLPPTGQRKIADAIVRASFQER